MRSGRAVIFTAKLPAIPNLLFYNYMITFVHKLHCWVIPGAFVGAIPVRLKHGLSFFHSFLERFIDIAGKN